MAAIDPERGLALSSVGISTERKVHGAGSLAMHVRLDGAKSEARPELARGEVFVDPTMVRPQSYRDFSTVTYVDLSGRTLSGSLIIPEEFVGRDPRAPLFAHLFVEDCGVAPRRYDLEPRNITIAGQLDLRGPVPSEVARVCKIGLKIGLNAADRSSYEGDLYLDAVTW